MRNFLPVCLLVTFASCHQHQPKQVVEDGPLLKPVISVNYNSTGEINTPGGYTRVKVDDGSFQQWLRTIPLKKDRTVYLYNGQLKRNQSAQFAVIDIPVGKKDIQQCADAVMRLRAEYLYENKKFSDIAFMDYNGKWYKWSGGGDRSAFDNYLQTVFGWCGSASLEKQLKPVENYNDIKAGDVFVQGGFPGHAMLVIDVAENDKGSKIFMLAQGYQPAQDIHVVVDPMNSELGPWYEVNDHDEIITPEWRFRKNNLKRW